MVERVHTLRSRATHLYFIFVVIVSEGYEAPFIGFILSGECHVLKQIEAIHTLPDGKTVSMRGSTGLHNSKYQSTLSYVQAFSFSIVESYSRNRFIKMRN